jgi:hypothetical protein
MAGGVVVVVAAVKVMAVLVRVIEKVMAVLVGYARVVRPAKI